jgi:hypothetical protein
MPAKDFFARSAVKLEVLNIPVKEGIYKSPKVVLMGMGMGMGMG